jgi:hypothetical protein
MNCFDCALRQKGTFPEEWQCRDGHHIGLTIEFMKIGCHRHWVAKPKATHKDYVELYAKMEGLSGFEREKLMKEFRFKFRIHDKLAKRKVKQLKLF